MKQSELKNRYIYNPDCNYYFISVSYTGDAPAWIRRPFQTEGEVREFLFQYAMHPKEYGRLEIYPEDVLRDEIYLKKDDESTKTTIRHYLFGDTYRVDSDYYESIIKDKKPMKWKSGYKDWIA